MNRLSNLVIAAQSHSLPMFFPSISSVKTNLTPSEYLDLLVRLREPSLLVSAYDIANATAEERAHMHQSLTEARRNGATVLLDSGNYESYWKRDNAWTPARLAEVLRSAPVPLAFCHDNQNPARIPSVDAAEVIDGVLRDQASAITTTVCPIVHGTSESLPDAARLVAERLQPLLLAVAERELGDGILARTKTLRAIHDAVRAVAPSTAIHVLGTGNPVSILMYAIAGADTFDGLEWCQTCVDPDTAQLHHFQQRDLVRDVVPSIVRDLPYTAATLVHNLYFLRHWIERVRDALRAGEAITVLASVLPAARREEVCAAVEKL